MIKYFFVQLWDSTCFFFLAQHQVPCKSLNNNLVLKNCLIKTADAAPKKDKSGEFWWRETNGDGICIIIFLSSRITVYTSCSSFLVIISHLGYIVINFPSGYTFALNLLYLQKLLAHHLPTISSVSFQNFELCSVPPKKWLDFGPKTQNKNAIGNASCPSRG